MKAIFWIIDFIIIFAVAGSVWITYSPSAGLSVFIALTYLHEIKEAVQKGEQE